MCHARGMLVIASRSVWQVIAYTTIIYWLKWGLCTWACELIVMHFTVQIVGTFPPYYLRVCENIPYRIWEKSKVEDVTHVRTVTSLSILNLKTPSARDAVDPSVAVVLIISWKVILFATLMNGFCIFLMLCLFCLLFFFPFLLPSPDLIQLLFVKRIIIII